MSRAYALFSIDSGVMKMGMYYGNIDGLVLLRYYL